MILFIASLLAGSARAAVDLEELGVFKGQDYVNNVVAPGFFFEGCVVGTGIDSGTLTIDSGTPIALSQLDPGEFCAEADFADQATLDAAYPSTGQTYSFTLVPSDAGPSVIYTITFTATIPTTFPEVVSPLMDDQVLADRDLPINWTFDAACPNCTGVSFSIEDGATGQDVFDVIPPLAAGTTSVTAPSSALDPGGSYLIELSNFDGAVTLTAMQNGDTYISAAQYERINEIDSFFAVARTLDLEFVDLLKGVDRVDGVLPTSLGYFFEGCVQGTGISDGTLTTPSGTQPLDSFGDEFCLESEFDDAAALDAAFPSNGETYTFNLTQTGGAMVSIPLVYDVVAPGAFTDFTNPADLSTVPADQDLDVTWTLDQGNPACTIGPDCGDGIALFLIDIQSDMDVLTDDSLPITATNKLVPSSVLVEGGEYDIEVETFTGGVTSTMDGESDTYNEARVYEDINLITVFVPEPSAVLLSLAALGSVLGVMRMRRS